MREPSRRSDGDAAVVADEHRVVIHLRAKTGRHGELLGMLDRLEVLTAARQQPGFLAAEVQVAFDDEDEVLV